MPTPEANVEQQGREVGLQRVQESPTLSSAELACSEAEFIEKCRPIIEHGMRQLADAIEADAQKYLSTWEGQHDDRVQRTEEEAGRREGSD